MNHLWNLFCFFTYLLSWPDSASPRLGGCKFCLCGLCWFILNAFMKRYIHHIQTPDLWYFPRDPTQGPSRPFVSPSMVQFLWEPKRGIHRYLTWSTRRAFQCSFFWSCGPLKPGLDISDKRKFGFSLKLQSLVWISLWVKQWIHSLASELISFDLQNIYGLDWVGMGFHGHFRSGPLRSHKPKDL